MTDVDKLINRLEGILPEFQNKHYDTFEIRVDLMIEDILRSLKEVRTNYDKLVKVAIETAFDEQNNDTEFLLRTLLSQGKILFDNEKKEYVNPQKNKELEVNGIMFTKEKIYLINDDKLDDYTKQMEYKYNGIINRIDLITEEFKNIINNSVIKYLPQYEDLIETLSNNIDMLDYIRNGEIKSNEEDMLPIEKLDDFYRVIKEGLTNIGKLPPDVLDNNNSEEY